MSSDDRTEIARDGERYRLSINGATADDAGTYQLEIRRGATNLSSVASLLVTGELRNRHP